MGPDPDTEALLNPPAAPGGFPAPAHLMKTGIRVRRETCRLGCSQLSRRKAVVT